MKNPNALKKQKEIRSAFCIAVGRILEADECPLEVQSRWSAGEQRTFTLTQAEFEVSQVSVIDLCGRELARPSRNV